MKVFAAAILLLLAVTGAMAQPVKRPAGAAATLAGRMDRLARFYAGNGQFMGAVLVAKGDRIVLDKGYGLADIEWAIADTPATKFRLGSITKQFTAAAVLLLVERGRMALDAPVKTYMPDAPAAWDAITIRHLLNHTSGIPNFTGFADFNRTKAIAQTPAQLVARFRDKPLEFAPGTRFTYTNSGYVLLGYLIEQVSGGTYEKFLSDNIFTPLGMKDSGCDSNTALIPRRASGYTPGAAGLRNADFVHMSIPIGGGVLYSTTGDLLRWERALFGGKLLKPQSLAVMTTPVLGDYGMGVFVRDHKGHREISHPGAIEGFNSHMIHYPDDGLTVIVLANQNGPTAEALANKLAAMALGETGVIIPSERRRVALDAAAAARYAGRYQVNPTTVAEVTAQKNRLFLKIGGGPASEMLFLGQGRFFRASADDEMEFAGPIGASAAELIRHPEGGGADDHAPRIAP